VRRTAVVEVAREIAASEHVIASSLHGVIVADAYGVPAEPRLARRSREREGGDFKWRDYHASLDSEPNFGVMRTVDGERIGQMRRLLVGALEEVADAVRSDPVP